MKIRLLLATLCPFALAASVLAQVAPITQTFALPDGKTGAHLRWDLYMPNTPPPWNVVLVIHVGGFRGGERGPQDVCQDLAAAGFVAAAIDYRVDKLPSRIHGQSYAVYAPPATPNQPGDVQLAVLAARFPTNSPLKNHVTGWVAAVGGSSGAAHALWCAATGTLNDTKVNAAALLSGPYLFSDPQSLQDMDVLGCIKPAISSFVPDITAYCQTSESDPDFIEKLNAGSPLNQIDATVSPLLAFATKQDPITPYQLIDLRNRLRQLNLLSNTADYSVQLLEGASHAFEYWHAPACDDTPAVKYQMINWLQAHMPGHAK